MKRAIIAFLTLLFLGVFLTPGQAQAHGNEIHKPQEAASSISYKEDASTKSVTVSSASSEKPCKGCCSGKFMACCISAAGLPANYGISLPFGLKDIHYLAQLDELVSSDPEHQYRPPRISA